MKRLLLLVLVLLFPGCMHTINSNKLMKLSLGMTKEEVRNAIYEPYAFRGATTKENGQKLEVYEYMVYEGVIPWSYLLCFVDGKLTQWGKANDWQKPADIIQEVRVR